MKKFSDFTDNEFSESRNQHQNIEFEIDADALGNLESALIPNDSIQLNPLGITQADLKQRFAELDALPNGEQAFQRQLYLWHRDGAMVTVVFLNDGRHVVRVYYSDLADSN